MDEILKEAISHEVFDEQLGAFNKVSETCEYTWTIEEVPKNKGLLTQHHFAPTICGKKLNWAVFLKHNAKASVPIIVSLVSYGINSCRVTPTIKLTFAQKTKPSTTRPCKYYGSQEKDKFKPSIVGDWEVYEFMFKREDRVIPNFNHLIRQADYSIIIEITLTFNSLSNNPLDKGPSSRLGPYSNFAQALEQTGELADLEIVTQEETYFVQRDVLTLRSEYFFFKFKGQSGDNKLHIENVKSEAVYEMLRYLYTGKAQHVEKHVYDLLELAHTYKIHTLMGVCESALEEEFAKHKLKNINKIVQATDKYKLDSLKKKITDFIISGMTEEFKDNASANVLHHAVLIIYNVMAYSKQAVNEDV